MAEHDSTTPHSATPSATYSQDLVHVGILLIGRHHRRMYHSPSTNEEWHETKLAFRCGRLTRDEQRIADFMMSALAAYEEAHGGR